MKQPTADLYTELEGMTKTYIETCNKHYLSLDKKQLNWKPDPDKWSIGECLEHLNLYGDYYIPAIGNAIKNGIETKPSEKFKSGWLGNYSANAMLPKKGQITNKMKTLKDKNPAFSTLPKKVVSRFITQQKEFLDLLEQSKSVNLRKVKVPISIGKFIRFNLGDTFRFIIYHNERHMLQAERIFRQMTEAET